MADFSKTGSGNMRNQFFDHNFLFDFYSVRGSTAAPSGRPNGRWRGLWKFYFRPETVKCNFGVFFQVCWSMEKTRRAAVLIFGTPVERRTLYSN